MKGSKKSLSLRFKNNKPAEISAGFVFLPFRDSLRGFSQPQRGQAPLCRLVGFLTELKFEPCKFLPSGLHVSENINIRIFVESSPKKGKQIVTMTVTK